MQVASEEETDKLVEHLTAKIPEELLWDDGKVFEQFGVDKVLTQRYATYPEAVREAHTDVELREFAKAGRRAESFEN